MMKDQQVQEVKNVQANQPQAVSPESLGQGARPAGGSDVPAGVSNVPTGGNETERNSVDTDTEEF